MPVFVDSEAVTRRQSVAIVVPDAASAATSTFRSMSKAAKTLPGGGVGRLEFRDCSATGEASPSVRYSRRLPSPKMTLGPQAYGCRKRASGDLSIASFAWRSASDAVSFPACIPAKNEGVIRGAASS